MSCQFLIPFILLSPTRNIHAEFQLRKVEESVMNQSVSQSGGISRYMVSVSFIRITIQNVKPA